MRKKCFCLYQFWTTCQVWGVSSASNMSYKSKANALISPDFSDSKTIEKCEECECSHLWSLQSKFPACLFILFCFPLMQSFWREITQVYHAYPSFIASIMCVVFKKSFPTPRLWR
jgi:hypothetical protein